MTHVSQASKLRWLTYERFSPVPAGAVAGLGGDTGEAAVFLGRALEAGVMRTALLELGGGRGLGGRLAVYSADSSVRLVASCDILTEVEPVSYSLHILEFVKEPKLTSETSVLASSSMFRFEEGRDSVARMTKMMSYTYEKSLYLGHIRGAIRGLPTRVRMPSGETRSLVWGRAETHRQTESIMVEVSGVKRFVHKLRDFLLLFHSGYQTCCLMPHAFLVYLPPIKWL